MFQRLVCFLYRGHYWLTTRERDRVWIERTCIYCGKLRKNNQVPPRPMPGPPGTDYPTTWEDYDRRRKLERPVS